jgi:uracil-DNA glycosylase
LKPAALSRLRSEIGACRVCEDFLPLGPRPVLQYSPTARILIAGQAPGRRAHASGTPFDDSSGDRLRAWTGIDRESFYDSARVAILPMGFCYPGSGKSGDLPPRPECAATWHAALLAGLQRLELTLVLGRYALDYHFGGAARPVGERVSGWRRTWPYMVPLPHPSPRNNRWLKRNPWFEADLLPELRARISLILDSTGE